eukprot:m.85589 g.85589  ORF g.85589 m.85589 type:complete len:98 (+) comp14431_c0_seq1:31-324(+)
MHHSTYQQREKKLCINHVQEQLLVGWMTTAIVVDKANWKLAEGKIQETSENKSKKTNKQGKGKKEISKTIEETKKKIQRERGAYCRSCIHTNPTSQH